MFGALTKQLQAATSTLTGLITGSSAAPANNANVTAAKPAPARVIEPEDPNASINSMAGNILVPSYQAAIQSAMAQLNNAGQSAAPDPGKGVSDGDVKLDADALQRHLSDPSDPILEDHINSVKTLYDLYSDSEFLAMGYSTTAVALGKKRAFEEIYQAYQTICRTAKEMMVACGEAEKDLKTKEKEEAEANRKEGQPLVEESRGGDWQDLEEFARTWLMLFADAIWGTFKDHCIKECNKALNTEGFNLTQVSRNAFSALEEQERKTVQDKVQNVVQTIIRRYKDRSEPGYDVILVEESVSACGFEGNVFLMHPRALQLFRVLCSKMAKLQQKEGEETSQQFDLDACMSNEILSKITFRTPKPSPNPSPNATPRITPAPTPQRSPKSAKRH